MSLHASWIVNLSSFCKDRGNRNVDRSTCHEDVLVSSYEEVEQVRIAHAVHRGNDQLAELKLRVVSEGGFVKGVGCVENEDVRTVTRKTEGGLYRTQAVHYKEATCKKYLTVLFVFVRKDMCFGVSDERRYHKRLTTSLGVRHEKYSQWGHFLGFR